MYLDKIASTNFIGIILMVTIDWFMVNLFVRGTKVKLPIKVH